MFWRALLGLGMGGEWASGAVLVSETWPPEHRNKAISIMQSGWALGYILALLAAQVDPRLRAIRRGQLAAAVHPRHPAGVLRHLDPPLRPGAGEVDGRTRRRTRGAEPVPRDLRPGADRADAAHHPARRLPCSSDTGASSRGCPAFLGRSVEAGGAGLNVVRSLGWLIPVQLGAYAGYLTFGFIADRLGRRRAFVLFMIGAAVLAPVYGQFARSPLVLLLAGPLLGYFASGHFSMFGGFVAELFPTRIRATGQGTSYNIGRMAGAVAPYVIGAVATIPGVGIGLALGVTSAFFLLAAALVFTLPDRSGQALD